MSTGGSPSSIVSGTAIDVAATDGASHNSLMSLVTMIALQRRTVGFMFDMVKVDAELRISAIAANE